MWSQLGSIFSHVTNTLPCSRANKSPFLPKPTLSPGWNRNLANCRAKMVPAETQWPSCTFQPRCLAFGWVLRFLVLPPDFLLALRIDSAKSLFLKSSQFYLNKYLRTKVSFDWRRVVLTELNRLFILEKPEKLSLFPFGGLKQLIKTFKCQKYRNIQLSVFGVLKTYLYKTRSESLWHIQHV